MGDADRVSPTRMTAQKVRVVLVDDHAMVLEAMRDSLSHRADIEVVGLARSYREARDLLARHPVDVLVTDLHLADGRGTDLVKEASHTDPPTPVLLITGTNDRRGIEAALASGCAGFVSKSQGFDQLVDAVLAVAKGAAVYPASLLSSTIAADREPGVSGLSRRELEILQLLAEAKAVPEIAKMLHLSVHTVRNHVKQVLTKLGAHSQLEAVVIGARHGLVEVR